MNLFSIKDLATTPAPVELKKASGVHVTGHNGFASSAQMDLISDTIGELQPGASCYFVTDGAWSNIELLEYLLRKTGPANVYFTTWAISPEAITRFAAWHEELSIIGLWAILDAGLSNRKPEVYQQATGVFKHLQTCKCHAKVTVIKSAKHHLVLMGSANYTRNPRKEAGVIIWDKAVADLHIKWIMEEFHVH